MGSLVETNTADVLASLSVARVSAKLATPQENKRIMKKPTLWLCSPQRILLSLFIMAESSQINKTLSITVHPHTLASHVIDGILKCSWPEDVSVNYSMRRLQRALCRFRVDYLDS